MLNFDYGHITKKHHEVNDSSDDVDMSGLLLKATNVPCQGCETPTDMAAKSATIQYTQHTTDTSKLRHKNRKEKKKKSK